mmetsp:Transcript_9687/g.14594  ORF Transcript_9687/g.14594 Transcript_9687/m.14594 type:complete len:349 (+) Transcript_9687:22-1068(+)
MLKFCLPIILSIFFIFTIVDAVQLKYQVITASEPVSNTIYIYEPVYCQCGILVDTGRAGLTDNETGERLLTFLDATNTDLEFVLITHAHIDHYSGVPFIKENFPRMKFYVPNVDILDELLQDVEVLRDAQFLPQALAEFDWEDEIEVYPGGTTIDTLGSPLNIIPSSDGEAAETIHYSMVYDPVNSVLIAADILYYESHVYFGPTVNHERLDFWYNDLFDELLATYKNTNRVIPGHGPVLSTDQFVERPITVAVKNAREYMDSFMALLMTCEANDQGEQEHLSLQQIAEKLIETYPDYQGQDVAGFLTTNTAWVDFQNNQSCNSSDASHNNSINFLLLLVLVILLVLY